MAALSDHPVSELDLSYWTTQTSRVQSLFARLSAVLGRAASALLHTSTPVAVRATKFFLGQDDLEDDEEADEAEGGLDVTPPSKAEVYKATSKVCLALCMS